MTELKNYLEKSFGLEKYSQKKSRKIPEFRKFKNKILEKLLILRKKFLSLKNVYN